MKITNLPVDPGPAAWNCLLPEPAPAEVLQGHITADFLIIGGGFAGLAAARRLAQLHPQARIVLLEARRFAEGPAGRNSGFMIDLPHDLVSAEYGRALDPDRAQTRANRAGIRFASEMAQEYGLSDEAFIQSGKVNAAAGEKGHKLNLDYAGHLDQMGEAHELLDAAQMREMTGSDYYCSGLFTPGAAMIQPAGFVRGVAAGLKSSRVQLYENSPVVALERTQDWSAKTPAGTVIAPKVILAVNGHVQSFGHFKHRLVHVFTYASMTRALSADECRLLGGVPRWGVTPADPMGTTVRRISGVGGERIIVRNRFTCDPSMQVNDRRLAQVGRGHDKAFAARFLQLKGMEMTYRWGGRLCLSRNNVPAFGEVEAGLYSACCQNGLGTAKGTLHGMLAADMASGEKSDLLIEVLAQPEPVHLPPRPFLSAGANAVMRWGEFKAGREM
jgi:glycine/D-amino acid oxidase-like deaminating enzyme